MILFVGFMVILFLVVGIIMGLTPFMGRKSSQFGVSIPETYEEDEQLKKWMKQYFLITITSSILFTIPFFVFSHIKNTAQAEMQLGIYSTIGILLILVVASSTYLVIHKKVQAWKRQLPKESGSSQEIVVDLNSRKNGLLIPNAIIVFSNLIIIGGTALITWLNYQRIPAVFPIHWGMNFEPDRFATKSVKTVFGLLGIQLIMTLIFVISNYSVKKAKQALDPKNPSISNLKNRLFRQAWSRFSLLVSILTQLLLSALQFATVLFSKVPIKWFIYLTICYTLFVLGYTVVLSLKYGQGGERLKIHDIPEEKTKSARRYNEDRYWKLGIFYYNSDDPSIWIEKKFGIGITINFARWQSWATIGGIFLLIAILTWFSK